MKLPQNALTGLEGREWMICFTTAYYQLYRQRAVESRDLGLIDHARKSAGAARHHYAKLCELTKETAK